MKKRFTEEQIIRILMEAEAAGNIREICRQNKITEQTFYRWRNKYWGMEVSEAKRLKKLRQWLKEKGFGRHYTDPVSPLQNVYNNLFNVQLLRKS